MNTNVYWLIASAEYYFMRKPCFRGSLGSMINSCCPVMCAEPVTCGITAGTGKFSAMLMTFTSNVVPMMLSIFSARPSERAPLK